MRLLTIIGTRPEAIKMAPVLQALAARRDAVSLLALTGQHADLVTLPLADAGLCADRNLGLAAAAHSPTQYVSATARGLAPMLAEIRPDRVIVQGDTASAMAGALAATERGIPVSHVEAGLRTHDALPWPEEPFRCAIDGVADQLLAPTSGAAANLHAEGLRGAVHITGNSGIDALAGILARLDSDEVLRSRCDNIVRLDAALPVILVTLHRRENIGRGVAELCAALGEIARAGTAQLVMPLHPNPAIGDPVRAALNGIEHIQLLPAQDGISLVRLMQRSNLILTDSGGIQEEAPSLGKPVLVMRNVTERPEGVAAGMARLIGARRDAILAGVEAMLRRPHLQGTRNPYSDGRAAGRIVAAIFGEPYEAFSATCEPARREQPAPAPTALIA